MNKTTPARRFEAWPARLRAAIEHGRDTGFAWGKNDCCLFAANCIHAMTGIDPAENLRGYDSQRGASARLRRQGGIEKLAETRARRHGWPEIPPATAQRGDIVLVEDTNGRALAVVEGRWVLQPAEQGLAARPLSAGLRAWRIG